MKDRVKETFNQLASIYENTVDTKSLFNSEYERPSMIEQIPEDLRDMKVLDAGCAAGWYSLQLVSRGANVVATDISPEMVLATRRRLGDKADVFCLDLEAKLPFEDNTFDYIISSLTLHYIKDWNFTFDEFQRILKPQGILMFSVHHPFSDIKLLQDPNYFNTELIIDKWNKEGKSFDVPFYRRPLHSILNETLKYFLIEEVIEPQPTMQFKLQAPEKYESLLKCPQFLVIKAFLH
ncbi:class I SAM-dependent methyltransferase [Aquibacillus koreensis]|uniref:Class I SAM-dependent methyltransferase n=1 Tax=Aquibacillus koreensis TaxID=279446 RepID=A0A9X4AGZ1_9BACI|nr:class I SAM-dependent methyltransferase [Aquibacillus koreensis]MCT2536471.1 class I SAM-dependent methyltransferase [Aquibacillus koreensis]MDC3419441.1 class I SAM-dependent methyltransferase [Aquibacillus koreensis]